MADVLDFPQGDKPDFLIGPFEEMRVIVEGRQMPLLTAFREGGKFWLVCDHRFACGPFDTEAQAYQAAMLAGQCMAVTAGYAHLGAETKERPFAPKSQGISTEPTGAMQ